MSAQAIIAWSVAALAVVTCVAASRASAAGRPLRPEIAPPACRIDLSTAPVEELALLPEIGPLLAARIAADRAVHGPFASVDDLARVPGIGERKIAELRGDARVTQP